MASHRQDPRDPQPSFFQQVAAIPREERPVTLLAALFFFALMASYYSVRSTRDALGASRPGELGYLFLGTFAMTITVQPAFGWLVRRFGRRVILPAAYRGLAITTLGLAVLIATGTGDVLLWSQRVFFCWTSTYSIVGVALFWGMMADILGRERSLRLFGPMAVGGTLGAIAGSFAAERLKGQAEGPTQAILFAVGAALLLEACVQLARLMDRASDRLPAAEGAGRREEPIPGGIWSGFQRVAASPYLAAIALYVVVYVFGSTLAYQLGAEITSVELPDAAARTAYFARVDLWTNVFALLFQLFAARWILSRVGVGVALAAVPVVSVVGFTALAMEPTLAVLAVFAVARRSAEYGISKPGRDALYTVLSAEDKYKSKMVVDVAVYRGGDAAVIWIQRGLMGAGVAAQVISWGLVGLAGSGILLAAGLGRGFRRRAAAQAVPDSGR